MDPPTLHCITEKHGGRGLRYIPIQSRFAREVNTKSFMEVQQPTIKESHRMRIKYKLENIHSKRINELF